ncbi:MAG: hypothetical protein Q8O89_01805 [Nanoarchaeota archaeon]|nr:hypothetical protein [Nanoarchaeota archaeon]
MSDGLPNIERELVLSKFNKGDFMNPAYSFSYILMESNGSVSALAVKTGICREDLEGALSDLVKEFKPNQLEYRVRISDGGESFFPSENEMLEKVFGKEYIIKPKGLSSGEKRPRE